MKNQRTTHFLSAILWSLLPGLQLCPALLADDWITWRSSYTHDPVHGGRVDQYALHVNPIAPDRSDFQRSGFRNFRSTLQTGQSADNMHIVEQWGQPAVPYEQWRFPYRPYGVPYDAWGPQAPYGILNGSMGYGGPGFGYPPYPPHSGTMPGGAPGAGLPVHPYYPPGGAVYPPGYGVPHGGFGNPSRGFPLTPPYQNQPWFDGTYPSQPPLDPRSDAEFFHDPRTGPLIPSSP